MSLLTDRIRLFNKGRLSVLLPYKYAAMRGNSFRFYRGSCHLFYEDFPQESPLITTPNAFLCGDLHMENFGIYMADDEKIYFDINDFDESLLGPVSWDICRLLTSLYLAAHNLGFTDKIGEKLNHTFIDTYTHALSTGHEKMAENGDWSKIPSEILKNPKQRDLQSIIKSLTEKEDGVRRFIADKIRLYPVDDHQRERAMKLLELWNHTNSEEDVYRVIDIALRIAGTGSLGLERFIALLKSDGDGEKDIVDIKIAKKSSALPYCTAKQPEWEIDAERIKKIQRRMQIRTIALLSSVKFGKESYVIKEIQPTLPKVNILLLKGKQDNFEKLVKEMARVLAWAQVRSSGWQGSASLDEMIAFANTKAWQKETLAYSHNYYLQTEKYYKEFVEEYDEGTFRKIK
jgi:uncharacterized protein (DUF2252 family)